MKSNKIALVDVCDVAISLHDETLKHANIKIESPKSWNIFDELTRDETRRVLKLWNEPQFWKELSIIENARSGIEGLRHQGYRVVWVTSPWYSCSHWVKIRLEFLKKNFDSNHEDVIFTSSKYLIPGDLFIDDRPKHIKTWQAFNANGRAVMFKTKFNNHFEWDEKCLWSKEGFRLCSDTTKIL